MRNGANVKAFDDAGEAVDLRIGADSLTVILRDGRRVTVPLSLYPSLRRARPAVRNNWRNQSGVGFHWPDLDLDLSTEGIVQGRPERFPPPPPRPRWATAVRRCQVFPAPHGWCVSAGFAQPSLTLLPSLRDALDHARRLAHLAAPCVITVHRRDGSIKRLPAPAANHRAVTRR